MKQAWVDLQETLKWTSTKTGIESLDAYFSNREILIAERETTHDTLWTLFPSGELVYTGAIMNQPCIVIADTVQTFAMSDKQEEQFEVLCYNYDWDGDTFNRVRFVGRHSARMAECSHKSACGNKEHAGRSNVLLHKGL